MQTVFRRTWVVLLLLALVGCQNRGNLSGKVFFQGQPVLVGSVLAVGDDGIPKSAVIQEGTYRIESLPAGPVKLAVNSPNPAKTNVVPRKPNTPLPFVPNKGWTALPEKYAGFDTSGLTCTIRGGSNSYDIKLE